MLRHDNMCTAWHKISCVDTVLVSQLNQIISCKKYVNKIRSYVKFMQQLVAKIAIKMWTKVTRVGKLVSLTDCQ